MQYVEGKLSSGVYWQTRLNFEITAHTGFIPVWAVFFVVKLVKRIWFCLLLLMLAWCGTLVADRQILHEDVLQIHVVAASDSGRDQTMRLLARDAVLECLSDGPQDLTDPRQTREWIKENGCVLEAACTAALRAAGCDDAVELLLTQEAFRGQGGALPSGVYQTLRITIGAGQGKHSWSVIFPVPDNGLEAWQVPHSLKAALEGERPALLRQYLLEVLGRLENFLWPG